MALVGRRGGRNFGWGRQLSYAGRQALKDMFGNGHYATVKAHADRWASFAEWCRSKLGTNINDARKIDRQTLIDYAQHLRQQVEQGGLKITTAQNRLSSVNRTLEAIRGDRSVRVASPSQALGLHRSTVRSEAPNGQDREHLKTIIKALNALQQQRVSAILHLARETGMRLREAILADLPRLHREAERLGRVNIQDGTKGSRSGTYAPRWITATQNVRDALRAARNASPTGSNNLLAHDESYKTFLQQTVKPAREILHAYGLKGFHELRAAYACERYKQFTGHAAPINGGTCFQENRELDHTARKQISLELGHNRTDVIAAYIGGRR
ncbi:integrase domain-containing protein [Pseudomonas chlororaphis]|uniref:integrase domain-containing protein n=1 Tax=Pseudomonas chlororaphis TaxID=587753 RepID=UPI000F58BAB8|nr:integrase domain-containing protein [Pseudomonas chlororaphis]